MFKILKSAFVFSVLWWGQSLAQPAIPFGVGAHLSVGQVDDHPFLPSLEVEPYLQIWVLEFGYVRLGYHQWSISRSDNGEEFSRTFSVLGAEALINLNPALRNPYLSLGWRHRKILDDSSFGDTDWQEWSIGVGGNWLVAPGLYLYTQVDYRWSDDLFQDPKIVDRNYTHYSVWMFNLGLTVFVY